MNSFYKIDINLKNFKLSDFNDHLKVQEYLELFSLNQLIHKKADDCGLSNNNSLTRSVSSFESKPFKPKYDDLCRLHYIALSRKCLNVLEFGSGYSTVFLAEAMRILSNSFLDYAKENIRVDLPFHIYAIEEEERFLQITSKRLGIELSPFVTLRKSSVEVILHDGRIATKYTKLPNISPDLIYIDGPSQFATTDEINGFSFNSKSRMPMSADVLFYEFFFEPGTLIILDGRTANARFLKSYLRRNWVYSYDKLGDLSYFELQEEPLGRFNSNKLEFCTNNKYLFV
jgi:hypothetical protein